MKKITLIMMILSVVSKVLGFAREIVLSNIHGASVISDAFIFSNNLSGLIFSVIIAAFVTGLIPMYTQIEKKEGEVEANLFINNVQNTMVLIALVLSLFFFFFTELGLSLLLPGASTELMVYLIPFTKVSIFSIILTCFIQVLTGFLHIKSSFIIPILIAFPSNIILIVATYLSSKMGYMILPYAIVIAYLSQATIIWLHARRKGFHFRAYINFNDKNLKIMLRLAIPLILGSATSTIGGLVNQSLVSSTVGGISYINYATRVGNIIEGVFGVAIVSVMYPSLSKMVAQKDFKQAKNVFEHSLITLILFILPAAIGMIFLGRPIVEFIYLRGNFTVNEVQILMPVFLTYSFGLVSYSTYGLMSKVFYSFQDTKTPMFVAIFNISIQIFLGIVLSNKLGLHGVTAAMAISSTIGVITLLILSKKLFLESISGIVISNSIKILVSSLIMGLVSYICYGYLVNAVSSTLALVIAISLGAGTYIVSILILKVNVVSEFMQNLRYR